MSEKKIEKVEKTVTLELTHDECLFLLQTLDKVVGINSALMVHNVGVKLDDKYKEVFENAK